MELDSFSTREKSQRYSSRLPYRSSDPSKNRERWDVIGLPESPIVRCEGAGEREIGQSADEACQPKEAEQVVRLIVDYVFTIRCIVDERTKLLLKGKHFQH